MLVDLQCQYGKQHNATASQEGFSWELCMLYPHAVPAMLTLASECRIKTLNGEFPGKKIQVSHAIDRWNDHLTISVENCDSEG